MKTKIYILTLYLIIQSVGLVYGAYLTNVPQTLTQPNGQVINCFMTGDEYYSWLHDTNNYTIVQNTTTGYYCYAILTNNELVATQYIVGVDNPANSGFTPGVNITQEQITSINQQSPLRVRNAIYSNQILSYPFPKAGTLNNIVIFICFSDQSEYYSNQSQYSSYYNNSVIGTSSMYNYYREVSYNNFNIISTFYPLNYGSTLKWYKDAHTRNYYLPKTSVVNINNSYRLNTDSGYTNSPLIQEGIIRQENLVYNAINYLKSQISSTLNIDINNDGYVDNVDILIQGESDLSYILKTKHNSLDKILYIYDKQVKSYNTLIEYGSFNLGIGGVCHEMYHTLGAPDLYTEDNNQFISIGDWDIMSSPNINIPPSMGAYMKYKYGGWIDNIPEINQSGHYFLQPITSTTNNCYKIASSNPNEFFILEFRKKVGTFESILPGTGLLIYRVCLNVVNPIGYASSYYLYRLDGTNAIGGDVKNAYFDTSVGRSAFSNITIPNCFLVDGSLANISVKNIAVTGSTISFDVRLCQNSNITLSNTNQLPEVSNAVNTIQTSGSVIVKSTDNVTFEAGSEIIINAGFEVQNGGQLQLNIQECGK